MTVETLGYLIDELRIQALSAAARDGITAQATLEWDLADTLAEVAAMLDEAISAGGAKAALAQRIVKRLREASVKLYGQHVGE